LLIGAFLLRSKVDHISRLRMPPNERSVAGFPPTVAASAVA
jgi:hypothetical protein